MTTAKNSKATAEKNNPAVAERVVVIGSEGYGLCYGRIRATDAEIIATKSVTVYRSRHVARWYAAKPGGISSLIADGPAAGSRVGAEAPSQLVLNVRNVFFCSPAAIAAFDAMVPAS